MLSEAAPAKINLTLRVGAPREDGYHPIDSLVVFADFGDRLDVREAPGLMLVMGGPTARDVPDDNDNLVLRAARALQSAAGIEAGAQIHLHKHIPVEAGLGGGSADAAAALRLLNTFWGVNWPIDRLAQLGAGLGSDVPCCIYSQPLRMRGRGEWIDILSNWPDMQGVLINPGVAVPTGPVFKAYDRSDPAALVESEPPARDHLAWLSTQPNDLEMPAKSLAPEIADALDWLAAQPGVILARMSGSGASCFAVCEPGTHEAIAAAYPGFAKAVRFPGASR